MSSSNFSPSFSSLRMADAQKHPYRVVLVCNFLPDRQESILRYGDMLFDSLKARGVSVARVRPRATVLSSIPRMPNALTKWIAYIDKFLLFPRALSRIAATQYRESAQKSLPPVLYHIVDHGNASYVSRVLDQPHVVTCHDALAIRSALNEIPENRTKWSGRILQNWILRSLKSSGMVACVSSQTEKEIQRVAKLDAGHTAVIPHALNYPYKVIPAATADALLAPLWRIARLQPPFSFLFHVGGTQWYKNREGLLDIFAEIKKISPIRRILVVAGKPHTPEIEQKIVDLGLAGDVFYVGEVTCEQLNALYSTAEALLFPSLAEGFGWPLIEAQVSGCPVFTTNARPMSEIGADAAKYFDPKNPAEAARIVVEGLDDRPGMVERGLVNGAKYSQEAMVESYLSLYDKVISQWKQTQAA